ncbi:membrane protein [Aquimarina atlantica]|uniref:Membrane protein n=1 Tax=Aquimarina atlantica TaxID=1317122 RepID=A0A023C010_9FLAO|nr:histidine kinase [Aquimarina atlantica]EZH75590.1 membrane protein [Aquimarina atlantica]
MITFLKKYKAFVIGFFVVFFTILYLEYIGFIKISKDEYIEVIVIFTFWWLIASVPIYKFEYFKKNKIVVYKILGLILLLIVAVIVDSYWKTPDNPIVIFLITSFWLGIFYVAFSSFFKKYKLFILVFYTIAISYFFYVRLFSKNLDTYLNNEKDTAFIILTLPIPILIILWLFEQWKWLKTLKAEKGKAELALLKSQVNPHFFFNTLNNLYGLTVEKSDSAPEVVLKLSDMMRYTIYEGKQDVVSLKDEIKYLENYIELHKIRYQKKVVITFDYTYHEDDKVAPLLFIILLENAFKHGVERLTKDAYIHINLTTKNNTILFCIENNYEEQKVTDQKGIGLDNLKDRLKLIYPQKHRLLIEKNKTVYKTTLEIETQ